MRTEKSEELTAVSLISVPQLTEYDITVFTALIVEAASTSKTLVNFYQSKQHNNP
jgi:hypothetical protein